MEFKVQLNDSDRDDCGTEDSDTDDGDMVSQGQYPHTPAVGAVGEPLYAQYNRLPYASKQRRAQ
jgi:hypothetical protein